MHFHIRIILNAYAFGTFIHGCTKIHPKCICSLKCICIFLNLYAVVLKAFICYTYVKNMLAYTADASDFERYIVTLFITLSRHYAALWNSLQSLLSDYSTKTHMYTLHHSVSIDISLTQTESPVMASPLAIGKQVSLFSSAEKIASRKLDVSNLISCIRTRGLDSVGRALGSGEGQH